MNQRNENRPGYKKTKVGWIPEEWECVPFGTVTQSSQYGVSLASSEDGTVPIVGMGHLQDGKLVAKDCQHVVMSEEEFEKYRLRKNDLLFNRTNSLDLVGKTALVQEDSECVFASYLVRFVLSKKGKPLYIAYVFTHADAMGRLKSLTTPGVSQFNINPSTLQRHFYVPLPPLPEQERIAEVLGAWDRAIGLTDRLIEAKQRLKKGLMQQLLTGRLRFPQFGKPARKHDEMSKGWKMWHLSECFRERRSTNSALPLLSITGDRGVISRGDVERKDTSNADKGKYKVIKPGDIGYNTMRMWQGVSAVSRLEGIVSPAYTICVPKDGHVSDFYGYLFKYPPMVHLFHRYSQGLVDDTLNLKFHHFGQIKMAVPSADEQARIAETLCACDREIQLLNGRRDRLQEQKKGLMQKLLTGEVRVPVKGRKHNVS